MLSASQSEAEETRYSPESLAEVVALAQKLEHAHRDQFTIAQVETMAAELGIDPEFIRRAMEQVNASRTAADDATLRRTEFRRALGVLAIPLVLGALAFLAALVTWPTAVPLSLLPLVTVLHVLVLALPLPLSLLLGFLSSKRGVGVLAGIELACVVGPTLAQLEVAMGSPLYYLAQMPVLYAFFGSILTGGLGWAGARVREQYFPRQEEPVTRRQLLRTLHDLRRRLERQKQRLAFLSLDVVGSTEMKRGAPELDVEYSFGEFREWAERRVRECGGQPHSAAGDGMMAMFRDERAAVRAARRLQEEIALFNAERNRLPLPFRLRCGISMGEVAVEEGAAVGDLHSPVIDRAAALQKQAQPGQILFDGEVGEGARAALESPSPLSTLPKEAGQAKVVETTA